MRGLYLRRVVADRRLVASGTSLRHLRPARFRRSRVTATAEELGARLEVLVLERQELRRRSASAKALERNRLQIARTQWELGFVLIDTHLPQPVESAA
jgi:hypothetical protein